MRVRATRLAGAGLVVLVLGNVALAGELVALEGWDDPLQDAARVRAAIAAVDDGGVLQLAGNFDFGAAPGPLQATVIIPKGMTIRGPATIRGGKNPLTFSPAESAPNKDIAIEGIRFEGATNTAINIVAANRIRITGCEVDGVATVFVPPPAPAPVAAGIMVNAPDGPPRPQRVTGDVTIAGNTISVGGTDKEYTLGIVIFGIGPPDANLQVLISGNRITNTTGHGIAVGDSGGVKGEVRIEDNYVDAGLTGNLASGPDGINCSNGGAYTVAHNRVIFGFADGPGIRLRSTTRGVVKSNDITLAVPRTTAPGPRSAGVMLAAKATFNAVLQNHIDGFGSLALSLTSLTPKDNTFIGNDHDELVATTAKISIVLDAERTTIIGGSGTIIDRGKLTVVKGDYQSVAGDSVQSEGGVGDDVSDAVHVWQP